MSDLKFEELNFCTDSEVGGNRVQDGIVHLRCKMTFDNGEDISIIKGWVSMGKWEVYSRFGLDENNSLKLWCDLIKDFDCRLKSTHDIVRFDTEDQLMSFVNKIRNYVEPTIPVSAVAF